jgi:hypothetical protein
MPDDFRDIATAYVQAAFVTLSVEPLRRKRFYSVYSQQNSDPGVPYFPDESKANFDRLAVVPLTILPRPGSVDAWSQSERGRASGWVPLGDASWRGSSVCGSTILFETNSHRLEDEPYGHPAAPLGHKVWDLLGYGPTQDLNPTFFASTGKLLREPRFMEMNAPFDIADALRIGEENGAKLLAEITTVPVSVENTRLRWVCLNAGAESRQFLAYTLVDGAGAKRLGTYMKHAGGLASPYLRPLRCASHQPRISHHDLLLLPTPITWPSTPDEFMKSKLSGPHEEWCFDDWFPAQPEACWVIREAEDSKPLMESFLLMPAEEPSDRPVFFVAVFAETEPVRLVKELAALYRVSPDEVLESNETMAHLTKLYEQLINFDLSQ